MNAAIATTPALDSDKRDAFAGRLFESTLGALDLVTVFEALHDMSRPVDALRTMHRLVAKDGAVLVMDERVSEAFELPTTETERFLYQCSVLLCLPNGMAEQPSAATGTVMREETMRRYAEGAGFSSVRVVPIEHELFRFYPLKP